MKKIFRKRRSLVRQYDQKDCGPAALLTVLRFYGGRANLPFIRKLCQTTTTGTTMYDMVQASKELGLEARGVIGDIAYLSELRPPCIAHLILPDGIQHYVVIFAVNTKSVQIGDPAAGIKKVKNELFDVLWISRALLLFEPAKEPYRGHSPSWIAWMGIIVRKERNWIYQTVFLGLVYTGIGLLTALFIQQIIDQYLPNLDKQRIILVAALLAILFLVRASAGYIRYRFLIESHKRIGVYLNLRFFAHIFRLPQGFFDNRKKGDITARLHDSVRIQNAVLQMFGSTVIDGMLVLASLIYMYWLSAQLTFYTLIVMPVYGLVVLAPLYRIRKMQLQVMQSYADLESSFFDSLNSISDIISFHAVRLFSGLNQRKCRVLQQRIASLGEFQGRLNFFADLTSGMATLFILSAGAFLVIDNQMQLGQMIAAYALLAHIIPATARLVDVAVIWQGASVASKRLLDILLQEKERYSIGEPLKINQKLVLRNVSFGWSRMNMFLKRITFILPVGQLTALFGPSGSGKSTLAHILLRKYPVSDGKITIDETDIRNINLREYRRHVALVPQHISVFNGTLIENILIGRELLSEQKLEQFIERFGLHIFLNRFQHGLYTQLGEEGRRLSGGEKQVLGLCRALIFNPRLLIIDEGLNAMDMHLYNLSIHILQKYKNNCAILINTHHIETLKCTDYVYLLGKGTILNEGKPSEVADYIADQVKL